MKKIVLTTVVGIAIMGWSLAGEAKVVDKIVAVVNNEIITLSDIDRTSNLPKLDQKRGRPDDPHQNQRQILNQLIEEKLLGQSIAESEIEITDDELAQAIKNILDQSHITLATLKAEIKRNHLTFDSYKQQLREHLAREKFIRNVIGSQVKLTDADLEDYYREHMGEFSSQQATHVAQIVLAFKSEMSPAEAEALEKKVEDIRAQLLAGASFSDLARSHSDGPNAQKGGDLGVVDLTQLLPEVAGAISKLNVGQISPIVPSRAGLHILKVLDRAKISPQDFEKHKDQIYQKLFEQRVALNLEQYLRKKRQQSFIDIKVNW